MFWWARISYFFYILRYAISPSFHFAVLPSDGDEKVFNNDDLEALTNKMRSVALKTLPRER